MQTAAVTCDVMTLEDDWAPLGARAPTDLAETRLAAHWAAQIPAAAGATLAEPKEDHSHTSLSWSKAHGALVGVALPDGRRAGLSLADLALVVLSDDAVEARCALAGLTLEEGLTWLAGQLGGAALGRPALGRPAHGLPAHPAEEGAPFEAGDPGAREELARWFGDASALLEGVSRERGASPVRCWPHHFDIATLLALDVLDEGGGERGGEEARSVGVGMTPGDGRYAEPYLYVTPWPYPAPAALAPLPLGRWHTDGWVGAVLTLTELVGESQPAASQRFIEAAIRACLTALGAD